MAKGAPDWQKVATLVAPSLTAGAPDWERTIVGPGGVPIGGGGTTGFGRAHIAGGTTFDDSTFTFALVEDFVSGVVTFDGGSSALSCSLTGHYLVTSTGYYTTNAVLSAVVLSGRAVNGSLTLMQEGRFSGTNPSSQLPFSIQDIVVLSSGDLIVPGVTSFGASGTQFIVAVMTLTYLGA